MNAAAIFSNIDNLFKFLFIAGIFLIMTSILYPLQRKQEIEIEILYFNKQAELLNLEIKELKKKVCSLSDDSEICIHALDSLKRAKNLNIIQTQKEIDLKIKELKAAYNKKYDDVEKDKLRIDIKSIITEYNQSKIEVYNNHLEAYDCYFKLFLVFGIVFTVIGILGWFKSTHISEIIKLEQLKTLNNE